MGFLKRLLGADPNDDATGSSSFGPVEAEADELERELDILRDEQERLDELAQRQLRYAKYAWQAAAQGGERRADDLNKAEPG